MRPKAVIYNSFSSKKIQILAGKIGKFNSHRQGENATNNKNNCKNGNIETGGGKPEKNYDQKCRISIRANEINK